MFDTGLRRDIGGEQTFRPPRKGTAFLSLRAATALALCLPPTLAAQAQNDGVPAVLARKDLLSALGAGAVYLVPTVLDITHPEPVACAPCDRSAVPFFDRWAVGPYRSTPNTVSDLLLAGGAVVSWLDLADEGRNGHAGIVASIESVMWAKSVVHLAKTLTHRKRPILYSEDGAAVAAQAGYQESWPSGHAATAAALATSYWLTRNRISSGGKRDPRAWVLVASAVGVAVCRVAAAKHFPSDVVTGLVVGAATAVVVHSIKF